MTNKEHLRAAEIVALQALAWVACDERLGPRLLALTGMTPAELRQNAGRRETLSAVIAFLEDHEPDLIACAAALDIKPEAMVNAGAILSQGVRAGE